MNFAADAIECQSGVMEWEMVEHSQSWLCSQTNSNARGRTDLARNMIMTDAKATVTSDTGLIKSNLNVTRTCPVGQIDGERTTSPTRVSTKFVSH